MSSCVVVGAAGRMGKLLCAAFERDGFAIIGTYDVENIEDLDEAAPEADLLVDFSHPAALSHIAAYIRRTKAAYLGGTTGFSDADFELLSELGKVSRVLHAANYSLGVAALKRAVSAVAGPLSAWDTEIIETHHNKKADAPSGTALLLKDAICAAAAADTASSGSAPRDVVFGREGAVGPRHTGEIGIHAVRGGTTPGTHEVHFFGTDEELTISHRALSRQIFVEGAVSAAPRLLAQNAPGVYRFEDLMFG